MSTPHDFDFLFGEPWRVRHRKLVERLVGCTDWIEFDGTLSAWPLLGGTANVDDNTFDMPDGMRRGVALRSFDVASSTWAIWWLGDHTPHLLDVPVVGRFVDGVGTFTADDTLGGHPIRARFTWSNISATTAAWEQAFSTDSGATWEVNWTMTFER